MMGERLGNNAPSKSTNNRHSVCLGAGFHTLEQSVESNVNRRSLSPTSEVTMTGQSTVPNRFGKSISNHLNKRSINDARQTSDCQNILSNPMSPEKCRRNSRSSIPVYIGKSQSANHTPESPKTTRSRHSMSNTNSNETIKPNKCDQNIRSRRSTFPRNSFSSMTSNSSSTSATNEFKAEDRYSKRSTETLGAKSPSHKQYQSHYEALDKKATNASLDNEMATSGNNNTEKNLISTMQFVPVSPNSKSRIPVLRSSSCRSVPQSSQSAGNAKSTIPRSICFGHGIPRTFNNSISNFKGGQNWYQMLSNKSDNGNKFRSYSIDKYAEQVDMDTSGIDKCNFDDMRMALD